MKEMNFLILARYPLRAMFEFIHGNKQDNQACIIENGFFSVAKEIFEVLILFLIIIKINKHYF